MKDFPLKFECPICHRIYETMIEAESCKKNPVNGNFKVGDKVEYSEFKNPECEVVSVNIESTLRDRRVGQSHYQVVCVENKFGERDCKPHYYFKKIQ